MTEEIQTGGLKTFVRKKGEVIARDLELEKNIEKGYEKYYQRKKKEKRIIITAIILLIISAGLFLILRK